MSKEITSEYVECIMSRLGKPVRDVTIDSKQLGVIVFDVFLYCHGNIFGVVELSDIMDNIDFKDMVTGRAMQLIGHMTVDDFSVGYEKPKVELCSMEFLNRYIELGTELELRARKNLKETVIS